MATLKKTKKILKSDKKNDNLIGTTRSTRLQAGSSKNAEKGSNSSTTRSSTKQSSVPLLDMLAEVASATLQNDPSLTAKKTRGLMKIRKLKIIPKNINDKKPVKKKPGVNEKNPKANNKDSKNKEASITSKETKKEKEKIMKEISKDISKEIKEVNKEPPTASSSATPPSTLSDLSLLKRPASQANLLNLDQIRVLSDRMLLEMFSELTSDELKRQYAYKCFLVPEKCSETFKSFGSETRARFQMKSHLLTHIAELLAEANGAASKTSKGKFMAEPLPIRTKRMQEIILKKRRKIIGQQSRKMSSDKGSKLSGINPMKSGQKTSGSARTHATQKSQTSKTSVPSTSGSSLSWIKQEEMSPDDETESEPDSDEGDSDTLTDESAERHGGIPAFAIAPPIILSPESSPTRDEPVEPQGAFRPDYSSTNNNSPAIKYVVDTTDQPGHDHNYTGVMGKKRGVHSLHLEYWGSSEEEEDENKANKEDGSEKDIKNRGYMFENPQLIVATPSFPFVYIPLLPNIAQIIEVKEMKKDIPIIRKSPVSPSKIIIEEPEIHHEEQIAMIPALIEYEVVTEPKPPRKRGTRVFVPEEMEPLSSGEEDGISAEIPVDEMEAENELTMAANDFLRAEMAANEEQVDEDVESSEEMENYYANQTVAGGKFTNLIRPHGGPAPDWERKMALKCIRSLRTRRSKDRGPIVCKICKSRTFTAQATLMYHYRSHAGIKPFICNLCGATFTRQHSLNYHMLIHNNKSRFVCEACGRNFRHPSHYKEHLRRHTGETPYECSDCTLRFKTRNTYKRHLKTRHGKILTAQGIITLSLEEFYKVRTNPRRRNARSEPTATTTLVPIVPIMPAGNSNHDKRDQETQWPDHMATIQAIQTIQELHISEDGTLIEGYYECPPEAVAFQVIEATPSI